MVRIDAFPPDEATQLVALHQELNPTHLMVVCCCGDCGSPVGVLCDTCREPLCAVISDCPARHPA